jgi:PhoH-like ATPase
MSLTDRKDKKIFVLDTSVILYDHHAIKSFKEHDVVIPITVLEELDNFKKGNDTKNFAAREFIRYIDKISGRNTLQDWVNINGKGHGLFKIEMNQNAKVDSEKVFGERKADHRILNTALYLSEQYPERKVVMVTKDINLRLKAKSLNLISEDYETGKIKDIDEMYSGRSVIEKVATESIDEIYEKGSSDPATILKRIKPIANHFYVLKNGQKSVLAHYSQQENVMERVKKVSAYKMMPF